MDWRETLWLEEVTRLPAGTRIMHETNLKSGACPVSQWRAAGCKICGNESGNRTHQAKEMMLGLREPFSYVECLGCGCVALADVPADLRRFYPVDYCGFRGKEGGLRGLAKRLRVQAYFSRGYGIGNWIARRYPRPDLAAMARMSVPRDCRILDVGCGSGKLLLELSTQGYTKLMGTDPFVESDIDYHNGVKVKKCFLTDMERTSGSTWDLIMFHHSFEHIPNQLETLQAALRLLSPNGTCVIRIPVIGSAWEEYGTNWVQLDAPRHLFLHTEKSLEILSRKAGLKVISVEYDSFEFQFWGSELYRRGISLKTDGVPWRFFSAKQLRDLKNKSEELNIARRGDQALFTLVPF
jgi:SAM-dependent methyltransferase